jgi:hypothetical protein
LPIACYGHETYRQNMRHLRRTDFHLRDHVSDCRTATASLPRLLFGS